VPGSRPAPRLTAGATTILAVAVLASGIAVASGGASRMQRIPPPTPVPPFGSPSPYPTALETPPPSARPPTVDAAAVALVDLDSGQVLYARNGSARRPVASLTKVMTAFLVLEATRPGERVTAGGAATAQEGAELGLRPGEVQPVRRLLYALLLQSANDAAVALAEHVAGDVPRFVRGMNRRARALGARRTRFASPSGLDDSGYSTALDLARITVEAYRMPVFARVARTRFRKIPAPQGEPRRIQSRNALLWLYPGTIGVKTGYTAAAGFCIVAAAEREGLRLAAVVLGSPDEAYSDGAALLNYGFKAFERDRIVAPAEPVGWIRVGGQRIEVQTGGPIVALVPSDVELRPTIRPAEGLSLPIEAGERVGLVVVRGEDGRTYGRVAGFAVSDVRRPPPPPWPERTLDRMRELILDLFGSLL
jgi:serine-type D-Ala-D-Ala carboxypeptidase (penicillin-binding protein 5/6)